MSSKARLRRQLTSARKTSERFLSDFKTPQQWTYQVNGKANQALWFSGHMGHSDNFFISLMRPEKAEEKESFSEKFGMGSQPTNNPDDYPPIDEVLDYMRQRCQTLLEVLESLDEEDLIKPTPDGAPDFLADYGSVFEMAIWHEGLHCGQLSMVRRCLGHDPVDSQKPAKTSK